MRKAYSRGRGLLRQITNHADDEHAVLGIARAQRSCDLELGAIFAESHRCVVFTHGALFGMRHVLLAQLVVHPVKSLWNKFPHMLVGKLASRVAEYAIGGVIRQLDMTIGIHDDNRIGAAAAACAGGCSGQAADGCGGEAAGHGGLVGSSC